MSILKKTIICGSFVFVGYISPALSADMPRLPPPHKPMYKTPHVIEAPKKRILPYVRLDAGLNIYKDEDEESEGKTMTGDWSELGFGAGIGVGVVINDNIRLDVTGEYRTVSGINQKCPATLTTCSDLGHGLNSFVGFVNGYFDVGHFSGFTPYIGGGIGAAKHETKDVSFGYTFSGSNDTDADLSFAWNLQAGTSFDISKHASIDLNYRYSNLGSFSGSSTVTTGTFTSVNQIGYDSITSHDIRAGLRYYLP